MKKSVLFITNAYPDFESSSRGIFIKKMASLLQREGDEITILTPKIFKKSHYTESQDGIKVYRFPFFAGDKLLIEYKGVPYIKMMLYLLSGFFLCCYLLFNHRFDLIHVHWVIPTGLIGIPVGSIFKKPVVITIHGSDFRMAVEGDSPILKRLFMFLCKKASHIQCVSENQMEKIKSFGIPESKLSVISMGIEERFKEVGLKKIPDGTHPTTILSNRNLLPIYNVLQLVRAIPLVIQKDPNVRFIIAGDGPEKVKVEDEAKALKVDSYVEFLGQVPQDQMPELLSKADIFVSTSLADGASVSLLEAMGAGAFPVVSDIPANREWVEDGKNGLLFSANNVGDLAEKILYAIRNNGLIEKARTVNRSLVEQKALWSVCIEKVRKIYERTNIAV